MALVFISHAHGDEALVRRVVTLLRDGLSLNPDDFFVSSQGGRGVAPAANIRDEILKELSRAPSLIVIVTPKSVGSPWVWLEAGNRLGSAGRSNPLFAVPSERFLPLVQPVADLRCIRLDNEEDVHELIKAVAENLGRPAEEVLNYNVALRAPPRPRMHRRASGGLRPSRGSKRRWPVVLWPRWPWPVWRSTQTHSSHRPTGPPTRRADEPIPSTMN
jgi:hypothetical protein